jgi:mRNA interferase MazF
MRHSTYTPAQGDLVWLDFNPQSGHEQSGRRPAMVVLSPTSYNKRLGLALVCPVTRQAKGYPFEVALPLGLPVTGVALSDHLKSQDWRARRVEFIAKLDVTTLTAVLQRARTLLTSDP